MPRKYRKSRRPRKFRGYKKRKVVTTISRSLNQHYPPALRTRLTMNTTFPMVGTAESPNNSATFAFFKQNSVLNCGPALQLANNVAPLAYSATFPSGINYLLSSSQNTNTLTAARAPYNQFLVMGSTIRLTMCTPSSVNANPIQVVIYPASENYLTSGMGQSIENLGEQPLSKRTVVPSVCTTRGITMKSSIQTGKLFGLTRQTATNDNFYTGEYNVDPVNLGTWIIGMNNLGSALNTEAFTVDCSVTVSYDIILFDRNLFGSVAPI